MRKVAAPVAMSYYPTICTGLFCQRHMNYAGEPGRSSVVSLRISRVFACRLQDTQSTQTVGQYPRRASDMSLLKSQSALLQKVFRVHSYSKA